MRAGQERHHRQRTLEMNFERGQGQGQSFSVECE